MEYQSIALTNRQKFHVHVRLYTDIEPFLENETFILFGKS
jgi:hypothetical protein